MKEVEHMIRTWVADVTSLLKKEKYLQYYKKVPDFRKEKADKIICQEGKALSIGVWILYEHMTYQKIWFLTCLTQDIMHFVPLRILKAMRRILGAISKVSNRLGWMLPDVFFVRPNFKESWSRIRKRKEQRSFIATGC